MCSAIPASSGARRPNASDSGPMTSWPSARPASVPVSVSCTAAAVVAKSSVIAGSAGRYMSMVNGPIAMSEPSSTTRRVRWARVISSPGGTTVGGLCVSITSGPKASGGVAFPRRACRKPGHTRHPSLPGRRVDIYRSLDWCGSSRPSISPRRHHVVQTLVDGDRRHRGRDGRPAQPTRHRRRRPAAAPGRSRSPPARPRSSGSGSPTRRCSARSSPRAPTSPPGPGRPGRCWPTSS